MALAILPLYGLEGLDEDAQPVNNARGLSFGHRLVDIASLGARTHARRRRRLIRSASRDRRVVVLMTIQSEDRIGLVEGRAVTFQLFDIRQFPIRPRRSFRDARRGQNQLRSTSDPAWGLHRLPKAGTKIFAVRTALHWLASTRA